MYETTLKTDSFTKMEVLGLIKTINYNSDGINNHPFYTELTFKTISRSFNYYNFSSSVSNVSFVNGL